MLIKDATGFMRFTIWENEIGKVEKGGSYKLAGVLVREYNGRKYLSTSLENSSIQPIYDIGPVVPDDHYGFDVDDINIGKLADQLQDVKVVGVIYLDDHKKCLKCASKVVGVTDDPEIGKCSKCAMLQCIEACQSSLTSRLMIKSTSDSGMPITLLAFGDVLKDIVMTTQNDSVTSLSLLKAPLFNVSFKDGIIRSVTH